MLYLIATPIGNLADITFRAIDTLKQCDLILCEDTRRSGILLKHYEIKKPLVSFQKFSERSKEDRVIEELKAGQTVGLISDAGTPSICDPGSALVKRCMEENIEVSSIPGPCAFVTALSLFPEPWEKFQFIGYLPKKETQMKQCLLEMLLYPDLTISYDTPHQLLKTLKLIDKSAPDKKITIARELTKIHETILTMTAKEWIDHYKDHPLKGELVLMMKGDGPNPIDQSLSVPAQVEWIQDTYGISKMDAIKVVSQIQNLPKNVIYKQVESE